MNEKEYRDILKRWLRHKLFLSNASPWYREAERRKAIGQVRNAFNEFLTNDKLFTAQKIAQRIINNEDILNVVLPIPGNPSYENSLRILNELIQYSKVVLGVTM
jgi:hypothetical protein